MQLVDVNIPLDNETGKHRGFGFVEYEFPDDAAEAIFNMNNGELNGRVLSVNLAKPISAAERTGKAVWHAEADSYFEKEGWTEDSTQLIKDDGKEDEGMMPQTESK